MGWFTSRVGKFLLKVMGIYFSWYLLYELWLLPDGTIDEWMSLNVASVSAGLLKHLGYEVYSYGRLFGIKEVPGIYIANGCSGFSAMGLFIGFVVAYPGRWIPRAAFILFGVGVLYIVNIARTTTLALTQLYWPEFFDITHNYSTTVLFYLVIFGLWVLWVNYGSGGVIKDTLKSGGSLGSY